jgi:cell division protease FtsH
MTMMLPEKDQYSIGRKKFLGNLVVMLAGRAAEQMYGEDITSGAANDLHKATDLVRKMVCEWGMSENIGLGTYQNDQDHVFIGKELTRDTMHSQETLEKIDREVERILGDSYRRAQDLLSEHKDALFGMLDAILEYESLDRDDVERIFRGEKIEKKQDTAGKKQEPAETGEDTGD